MAFQRLLIILKIKIYLYDLRENQWEGLNNDKFWSLSYYVALEQT